MDLRGGLVLAAVVVAMILGAVELATVKPRNIGIWK